MCPLSPFNHTSFKTCLKTPFPHKALFNIITTMILKLLTPELFFVQPLLVPSICCLPVFNCFSLARLKFLRSKDCYHLLIWIPSWCLVEDYSLGGQSKHPW